MIIQEIRERNTSLCTKKKKKKKTYMNGFYKGELLQKSERMNLSKI